MTYQQPPYQTTVMQPVVVQQPILVPVNPYYRQFGLGPRMPYLMNGVKCCGNQLPGACVLFGCFIGCGMSLMSLFILGVGINWDNSFWRKFNKSHDPMLIPAIILGLIGVPLACTFICLLCTSKKNYERQQRNQPSGDQANSSGHIYHGQGQAAHGRAVGVAAPMVVPMQPGMAVMQPGMPVTSVYPAQSTVIQSTAVSYPSASYPAQVQQPPQPGFNTAPGEGPYPGSSPYAPQKTYPPEYNQQPATAYPPEYNQQPATAYPPEYNQQSATAPPPYAP